MGETRKEIPRDPLVSNEEGEFRDSKRRKNVSNLNELGTETFTNVL